MSVNRIFAIEAGNLLDSVKFRDINVAYQKKVSFFSDMLSLYIYITLNKQKKHIGDISLNQYVPFWLTSISVPI